MNITYRSDFWRTRGYLALFRASNDLSSLALIARVFERRSYRPSCFYVLGRSRGTSGRAVGLIFIGLTLAMYAGLKLLMQLGLNGLGS